MCQTCGPCFNLDCDHLILINKCPWFRPIIVDEMLRRIIGKAVMRIARMDMEAASGSSQICDGMDGGIEANVPSV